MAEADKGAADAPGVGSTAPGTSAPEELDGARRSHAPGGRGFAVWIATAGIAGYAPVAPGTFGSAVGVLLFYVLVPLGLPLYALTLIALTLLGVWGSARAELFFERADDGRIVVDEVVGQLVTLLPLVVLRPLLGSGGPLGRGVLVPREGSWASGLISGGMGGVPEMEFLGGAVFFSLVVTGFVAFRVFDIWKPGVVRWAEQNFKGGWGVMADDLLAGAYGAVALTLPAYAVLVAHASQLAAPGGVL